MIELPAAVRVMSAVWPTVWEILWPIVSPIVTITTVVAHIAFAIAVYRDARGLSQSGRLCLVHELFWGMVTLIGGVFMAAIYWAIHHSRLNPSVSIAPPEDEDGT